MTICEAAKDDLASLLKQYTHLHKEPAPPIDDALLATWQSILADKNHYVLLGWAEQLVSSCVMLVVPNLTHGGRPYALIENVVTHEAYRGRGYASQLLAHARALAQARGCYKLMLMSSAKDEATLHFYEAAGFNRQDKTAFVQWL